MTETILTAAAVLLRILSNPVGNVLQKQLTLRNHHPLLVNFLTYLLLSCGCLGIAATALRFIYWDRQTKPVRPLREAIGREFRHSRPNVEGGRPKGRGPWTLRVSMTVDFPPAEDSPRANQIFNRVIEIAGQYQDLSKIDKVEVNLIQFVPQELAKTRKFTWTAKEPAGHSIPQ